ncbi:MAG: sensor histidine kinase [Vicinamibacteria bacterium]
MRHTRILMLAGLMVWLVSGIDMARSMLSGTDRLSAWTQLIAWLAFGAAFFIDACRVRFGFPAMLFVQALSALVLIWIPGSDGVEVALLVMVAGQLPSVMSTSAAVAWVLAQTVLAFFPDAGHGSVTRLAIKVFGYLSFQLFALGASGLAESERLAREDLAAAKGRLEAMQERLEETTREAERLRIARELHDSLGHHLTALGLDLELARHLVKGEASAPVERARALTSSLMADLRSAVTELRADSGHDLVARLRALERRDGAPRVDVEIGATVGEVPANVGQAFARVAQEIVTNATKHARASHVRLELRATGHDWVLAGKDDGKGSDVVRSGHGLSGMRERVEGLGGCLKIETRPGAGFGVIASVPINGASS